MPLYSINEDKCMDIDQKITFKILPPQAIVKNFIEKEENCNYEIYLMEILNTSTYFRHLSSEEEYYKPVSEENGQLDAISKAYSIDFKLLIAESIMEGNSILSSSITKFGDGVYGFGGFKAKKKKEMKCTNLCQAIRYLTLEELESIEQKKKRTFIERDIASFLDVLRTKKNILCFMPYVFDYKGKYVEVKAIEEVMKALYRDLKESMRYRYKNAKDFDTYVITIFADKFIVLKMDAYDYELVDLIATSRIKTFQYLMSISSF